VLDYGGTGIDLNRLFKNLTRDIINSASALVDSPSAKELEGIVLQVHSLNATLTLL